MLDRVRNYVRENLLFDPDAELQPDVSLLDAGILDSMAVMELVAYLEEEFGIELRDEDLVRDNLDTLNAIARLVEVRRSAA